VLCICAYLFHNTSIVVVYSVNCYLQMRFIYSTIAIAVATLSNVSAQEVSTGVPVVEGQPKKTRKVMKLVRVPKGTAGVDATEVSEAISKTTTSSDAAPAEPMMSPAAMRRLRRAAGAAVVLGALGAGVYYTPAEYKQPVYDAAHNAGEIVGKGVSGAVALGGQGLTLAGQGLTATGEFIGNIPANTDFAIRAGINGLGDALIYSGEGVKLHGINGLDYVETKSVQAASATFNGIKSGVEFTVEMGGKTVQAVVDTTGIVVGGVRTQLVAAEDMTVKFANGVTKKANKLCKNVKLGLNKSGQLVMTGFTKSGEAVSFAVTAIVDTGKGAKEFVVGSVEVAADLVVDSAKSGLTWTSGQIAALGELGSTLKSQVLGFLHLAETKKDVKVEVDTFLVSIESKLTQSEQALKDLTQEIRSILSGATSENSELQLVVDAKKELDAADAELQTKIASLTVAQGTLDSTVTTSPYDFDTRSQLTEKVADALDEAKTASDDKVARQKTLEEEIVNALSS
jgi:hypothetical protein